MKKRILFLLSVAFLSHYSISQDKIPLSNTIKIDETDTKEQIIRKAAHVIPTENQLAALRDEFIAFIHFGPNTFTRKEWGDGKEDPKVFDLKQLDTDQWCRAIKDAGMKMVIITAKHHDGFVLWPSRYTKHGVVSTGFRDGDGDILKELAEACNKYGLKLGVYLSPADLFQIENPEGLYGNLSSYTKRTIPRAVQGRPFANKTIFEFEVDDYNEYFLNQLFELLTEYGPIHEVWFDGAHPKRKGNQQYNYAAWKELIHTLAPSAVIFGRQDIRWCGNESGATRATEWNVIPYSEDPNAMNSFGDLTVDILADKERLYQGKYLHYQQAETNTSIREGWFYRDDTRQKVRSADDVFDIYERSVGGNTTFLLNMAPNRDGALSSTDVEVLSETGKRIRETYGVNLLKEAEGERTILDEDVDTYLELKGRDIIITTPTPITFNRLVLQESISTHSERVEKHLFEVFIDGQWQKVTESTNIGYKRILRFPVVTTDKLRIRILDARLTPAISNITAHYYKSRPPRLVFHRDIDGLIKIEPFEHQFRWKPHGENITANLNSDLKIYYTIDGTEPSSKSTEYTAPFKMDKGVLKSIAIINELKGSVNSEQLGLIKRGWKLINVSSVDNNYPITNAFDSEEDTYWMSKEGKNHYISIDCGSLNKLNGFAYTPQQHHSRGMMTKGYINISDDGKKWHRADDFEFGNLINDPTKRYHYFKDEITARYVQIVATEIAENGNVLSIAEIDLW